MVTAPSWCKAQAQGDCGPQALVLTRVRPSRDSLLPFLSVTPPVLHPRGQRLHGQVMGRSEVNIVPPWPPPPP